MKISIDEYAGFCPGVKHVVEIAEQNLTEGKRIVALGSIIHNEKEIERLKKKGLSEIAQEQWEENSGFRQTVNGDVVLIRSHGVPPQTLDYFEQHEIPFINATCWRVKRVQKLVRQYSEMGCQVVIVGKANHPEVKGLLGYAGNNGIVVYLPDDLALVDSNKKTLLLAQTTIDEYRFKDFAKKMKKGVKDLIVKNTICPVIQSRHQHMERFTRSNELIVMIAGKNSSNSLVLFNFCKTQNSRSYFISDVGELKPAWFENVSSVGITGGASTPYWQLVQVRDEIIRECSKKNNT